MSFVKGWKIIRDQGVVGLWAASIDKTQILQLSNSSEFWESMGSKRPSWLGTLEIHDFALSENFKECGVVVMCQCLREYLVKICMNLRMGSE